MIPSKKYFITSALPEIIPSSSYGRFLKKIEVQEGILKMGPIGMGKQLGNLAKKWILLRYRGWNA